MEKRAGRNEKGLPAAGLPVAAGALILLVVALLFNNIPDTRKYPEYRI